ncbi:MAG: hypothetical protein INF43_05755 [Alphaproteobacteria bacterium]|nr:hypothetical protein [Alphaproteobacteria bacterium]
MEELELLRSAYARKSVIISIDGLDGVGKTPLGRYLAHKLNLTLFETDLFFSKKTNRFQINYRTRCINKLIKPKLRSGNSLIIEGICVLKILKKLDYSSNFHIRLNSISRENDSSLIQAWNNYKKIVNPIMVTHKIRELQSSETDGGIEE